MVAGELAGEAHGETLPEGAGLAVSDTEYLTDVPDGLLPSRDEDPLAIGKPVKYVGAVEAAKDLVLGLGIRAERGAGQAGPEAPRKSVLQ